MYQNTLHKNNWRFIFILSLISAGLIVAGRIVDPVLKNNDKIIFIVQALIILSWGVMAGGSSKNETDLILKKVIFKDAFWILILSTIFTIIIMSAWFNITHPLDPSNFSRSFLGSVDISSIFAIFFILTPFFVGYVPAVVIKIILNSRTTK